jgi:hypothetical protein
MNAFVYVLAVILIALQVWILAYTVDLREKNCACAIDWRLTFIQFAIIFNLLAGFIAFYVPVIAVLTVPIAIAFIIVGLMYIQDMKSSKCSCSENRARDMLEILLYVSAVMWVMSIVFVITGGIAGTILLDKLMKNGTALKPETIVKFADTLKMAATKMAK